METGERALTLASVRSLRDASREFPRQAANSRDEPRIPETSHEFPPSSLAVHLLSRALFPSHQPSLTLAPRLPFIYSHEPCSPLSTLVHARVARRYTLAFPLFAGPDILTSAQADAVVARIFASDMMSEFGVRSTSSNDPVYNNEPTLTPYSNWQGPVWINANAIIVYGLLDYGYYDEALDLANRTINVLYNDIVATKTWHEAYDSSDGGSGAGLAAEGFLSWNTLGYRLLDDVRAKKNPFQIY